MDVKEVTLERIEKKLWQLMLLGVVVILYLTVTLLGVHFFGFMGKSEYITNPENAYKYSIFLSILILLFCAHMIIQQRKLLNLSRAFFQEKEASYQLSQDVKTLSALLEVSSSINSQQDLLAVLNTITREMLTCFRADRSSIMLIDRKTKTLRTMASLGKGAEGVRDALLPVGKGIAGWVVKHGQPLLLNGEVNPAQFPGARKKSCHISSAMCVPLKVGPRTIGALNVNLMETDRTFSDSDLKLVNIFAHSAAIAINNAVLFKERLQRIELRTLLEQLHSPQVVEEMVGKNGAWRKPTKMRAKHEMTVLFADIRGFSSIMTHLELEEIMDFLDAFYNAMTGIVFDNGGSIDKFIGDEVMAFFGAPLPLANASESAARAAMQMITVFEGLRKQFSSRSHHFNDLGIGIGMNTGTVFVGHVGSRKRYDYTVVGSAVNLARRMCSHAASNEILVSAKTAERLNGNIPKQFVDKVPFKGLQAPVDVFRIA